MCMYVCMNPHRTSAASVKDNYDEPRTVHSAGHCTEACINSVTCALYYVHTRCVILSKKAPKTVMREGVRSPHNSPADVLDVFMVTYIQTQ